MFLKIWKLYNIETFISNMKTYKFQYLPTLKNFQEHNIGQNIWDKVML
jgi:hypothetical protein